MGASMVALRVSEWKRHGLDRLYVNAPDGKAVAWFDRRTGHIEVVDERLRQQILEALTPYMIRSAASPGGVASTLRTPPPSDYDLASRRPGQALRDKIRADCPSLMQRSLAWALRRPENASWRTGLRGERIVSRELARLRRHGWRILHSIPLSPTWDPDDHQEVTTLTLAHWAYAGNGHTPAESWLAANNHRAIQHNRETAHEHRAELLSAEEEW